MLRGTVRDSVCKIFRSQVDKVAFRSSRSISTATAARSYVDVLHSCRTEAPKAFPSRCLARPADRSRIPSTHPFTSASSSLGQVDTVVVGAGVVGLAVARELALSGREVIVLEAAGAIGTETSSRNSEVIHAGIYYPQGSLKALTCVRGKELLYAYCAARDIPHERIGKLIVAVNESQIPKLEALQANALQCGVSDLTMLSGSEARALEPEVSSVAALLSPSTGIIDSHSLMESFVTEAEEHGVFIAFHSTVLGINCTDAGHEIRVLTEDGETSVSAREVVNSAGLHAPALGLKTTGLSPATVPTPFYARGVYFTTSARSPFKHLIYPLPEAGGLGVHATNDLAGQVKFGPDVEWIDSIDYTIDPARVEQFETAVKGWWPNMPRNGLHASYAGIRPKISGPGTPAADFVVQGERDHGVRGLVNLYGIESPGLTASMAIAEITLSRLNQQNC